MFGDHLDFRQDNPNRVLVENKVIMSKEEEIKKQVKYI